MEATQDWKHIRSGKA